MKNITDFINEGIKERRQLKALPDEFYKFMVEYLPDEETGYNQAFTQEDDCRDWFTEVHYDKITIYLDLYSVRKNNDIYIFLIDKKGQYSLKDCNKLLKDNNKEHSIVKKFMAGLYEFFNNSIPSKFKKVEIIVREV